MRHLLVALAATALVGLAPLGAFAQTAAEAKPASVSANRLSDAAIRQILAQRVDLDHQSRGMVVGVIEPRGRRVIAHGLMGGGGKPVDGQTLFEIGSVTKALTSLLLADMVRRGEVKLEDPVADHLPAGTVVPTRNGKAITLIDLATHTSGLPRLPTNMAMKDPLNPYADYTEAQLDAFLRDYALPREVGATYEYSNLGVGLLGRALAYRAGGDYETVLKERVLAPLRMTDTAIALSPTQAARFSSGHNAALEVTPHWNLPSLAGAGALRSTADDLLRLLAAELGYVDTPLKAAMADQLVPRRPAGGEVSVALGWHIWPTPDGDIVTHSGGTMGFQSFVGFNRKTGLGVVALSNTAAVMGVDDIGLHLMTGGPLKTAPKSRVAVPLPAAAFDKLVGRYAMAPGVVMTIRRDGERMIGQLTGQPPVELFAESPTTFFLKVVDAQLTFTVDTEGRGTAVTLHQNGQNTTAQRLADGAEPSPPPRPAKVATLSSAELDALTGSYALAPGVAISVTRKDQSLFAQITGQPAFEVFPESPTKVVWTIVPADATFTLGPDGKATSLTLHQGGRSLPAPRSP
jgi:CubicO group peptidase (beta-lactamase class C family)